MLKVELEKRLEEAKKSSEDYANDRIRVMRESKDKDKEIQELLKRNHYITDQMKQISQSVYTVLQVKYPDIHHPEFGATEHAPDCEEKRFLEFIHQLCVARSFQNKYDGLRDPF